MTNTLDPLGGSFFVEFLTDRLEAKAERYIKAIDELGGMVNAIEQGYVQKQIEQSAYDFGKAIENTERIIVGVNKYQEQPEYDAEIFTVPEESERNQTEQLARNQSWT